MVFYRQHPHHDYPGAIAKRRGESHYRSSPRRRPHRAPQRTRGFHRPHDRLRAATTHSSRPRLSPLRPICSSTPCNPATGSVPPGARRRRDRALHEVLPRRRLPSLLWTCLSTRASPTWSNATPPPCRPPNWKPEAAPARPFTVPRNWLSKHRTEGFIKSSTQWDGRRMHRNGRCKRTDDTS